MLEETPEGAEPEKGWSTLRAQCVEVLQNLFDVRLRTIITTQMAPAIYVFLCTGVLVSNIYLTYRAFRASPLDGWLWALLLAPVSTIIGLIAVRVFLEFLLSLFRILVHMETLIGELRQVSGRTESIAERVDDLPLPRIQFWRSRRRGDGDGKRPE